MVTLGVHIAKSVLSSQRKVDDLIEYAGPILSLYRDGDENMFLRYWSSHDEELNRWLIVPVTIDQLNAYLDRKISLREVLLHPEGDAVMILDTDEDQRSTALTLLQASEIPVNYLPNENSFYALGRRFYTHSNLASNSSISAEYRELSEFVIGEDGILTHTSTTEAILS
jgi:hypothetical protein